MMKIFGRTMRRGMPPAFLLALGLLLAAPSGAGAAASATGTTRTIAEVTIDGARIAWSAPPYVSGGVTMVPLREAAEALGAHVRWDAELRAAVMERDGDRIVHRGGTAVFAHNKAELTAQAASRIEHGVMMVPLRGLADALKATLSVSRSAAPGEGYVIDAQPDEVSVLATELQAADAYLIGQDYSGLALVAVGGDTLLRKGYGLARDGVLNRPDMRSRIASISKSFTAAAVLQLVQSGKLALTDSIERYVPGLPGGEAITIHMLLSHTSGLPSNFTREAGRPLAETVDEIRTKTLAFEPGSDFKYSNNGYVVLAYLIERLSGMSYGDFVAQRLTGPAGLMGTAEATPETPVIAGHIPAADGGWEEAAYYVSQSGTGTLYSTVDDLLRWDAALLAHELLDETLTEAMYTPYSAKSYGYGWMIGELADETRTLFHNGSGTGYSTGILRIPEQELTIILLGNRAGLDTLALMEGVRQAMP
ncbi:serine hydrolase [Paenibacillus sp. IB182496]|uniref:Serine hydrolase n=1 Tax=Paenibacillus sabuli TaxID=2772509 RepID=A0A927GQA5_9BACL|nr:serine hydrolase [Paenibacillus sabuli]MBD2844319.1 serine hydrolase [Paenibacillus sabuli]